MTERQAFPQGESALSMPFTGLTRGGLHGYSLSMSFMLARRSVSALLRHWVEIIVAIVLLAYSLKWFLLFWFLRTIYSSAARDELIHARMRVYQLGNECKLIALMKKLGVEDKEVDKVFEEARAGVPDYVLEKLKEDVIVTIHRT